MRTATANLLGSTVTVAADEDLDTNTGAAAGVAGTVVFSTVANIPKGSAFVVASHTAMKTTYIFMIVLFD